MHGKKFFKGYVVWMCPIENAQHDTKHSMPQKSYNGTIGLPQPLEIARINDQVICIAHQYSQKFTLLVSITS